MFLNELFDQLNEGRYDPNIFKAIFVTGAPGSGKDTVIKELHLLSAETGMKEVNIDNVTIQLKTARKQLDDINDNDYEQFKDITLRRQSIWMQNYLGLVINVTGRDVNETTRVDALLKTFGYDTYMVYVAVENEDIALNRTKSRYATSKEAGQIGRHVSEPYFRNAFKESTQNALLYAMHFGKNFSVIDNSHEETLPITSASTLRKVKSFLKSPITPRAQAILGHYTK